MGWQVGYDSKWQRDIGYGVPAICDPAVLRRGHRPGIVLRVRQ